MSRGHGDMALGLLMHLAARGEMGLMRDALIFGAAFYFTAGVTMTLWDALFDRKP